MCINKAQNAAKNTEQLQAVANFLAIESKKRKFSRKFLTTAELVNLAQVRQQEENCMLNRDRF